MPNGLKIKRVSVPGVPGIIYEARPNVSFDVFSLCLKSGNACILKGGSDADCPNCSAIISVIHDVLKQFETDLHIVELLPSDREATTELLHANGYVDLIIQARQQQPHQLCPPECHHSVIETGAGICHTFFDRYGDVEMGAAIINNAKTRRVSVCNALDCLLVDADRMKDLPALCTVAGKQRNYLCRYVCIRLPLQGHYPAQLLERSYGRRLRYGILRL